MNHLPAEQDRAQRLMAMGEMAASLAHEIRNPLGSMELFCSLLKKDLADQPNSLGLAEQIHLGIRTLDRIISNCLQFARGVVPRRQRYDDVQPLISEAMTFVAQRAAERSVACTSHFIGEGSVDVDSYLLNQILLNILFNAVDAASAAASDRTPAVSITSDLSSPTSWKITILDNGVGIAEVDQTRIFDPFFTTKEGGTGLGLPIVHSIVSAHGGSIALSSTVGQGTSFAVTLPRTALS